MTCNHQADGSLSMVPLATSAVVPLLYLAELRLGNLLRRQLSPLRITPLQYVTLTIIASRGTTSQEGLIEQIGVSESDLISSIIPICDRGLLGRDVVAGGAVTLCLTEVGRGILDAATRLASSAAIGKVNLDEQDMEQLLKFLARIIVSPEIPCPACKSLPEPLDGPALHGNESAPEAAPDAAARRSITSPNRVAFPTERNA